MVFDRALEETAHLMRPIHEGDDGFITFRREMTLAHARQSEVALDQREVRAGPNQTCSNLEALQAKPIGFERRVVTASSERGKGAASRVEDFPQRLVGGRTIGVEKAEFCRVLFDQVIEPASKTALGHASDPRLKPHRADKALATARWS